MRNSTRHVKYRSSVILSNSISDGPSQVFFIHVHVNMQQQNIRLGGLDIDFPYNAYGIQKAMLAKIAVALSNKEHALIESPTGTGKSLSLLCSTLAWKAKSKELKAPFMSARMKARCLEERRQKLEARPCSCGRRSDDQLEEKKLKKAKTTIAEGDICRNCQALEAEDVYTNEIGETANPYMGKIPKIYYGTRTHKQISQVVRELKKTTYTKDLRMNILSSRDRTCINEAVRDAPDRNDKCQELTKGNKVKSSKAARADDSCPFYKDSNQMAADFSLINEEHSAWDIEDSVEFGNKYRLCPYYGLRSLQEDADITFCPYNYLLDSNIRSALQINLKDAIIILDEAHNIEDICRDSASFILNTQQIDEILSNINRAASNYIQGSTVRDAYDFFRNQFTDIKAFLVRYNFERSDEQNDNDCLARRVMAHHEMLNGLEMMDLGPSRLAELKENLKSLRGDDDNKDSEKNKRDESQDSALASQDTQIITQMANTLDFIYADKGKHSTDYRCIVSKHLEKFKPGPKSANKVTGGDVHIFQLSLLCMNSGIAFRKIHESCWSVIVASGTLSPIESLKTELGCHFSQIFEGSHVIEDDRINASILSVGPKKYELNCSYGPSQQLPFQDEVGSIVEDVCKAVPNGVLIFFPSYDRMEILYQRWFTTKVVKNITSTGKKIFREQRSFTSMKFEEELRKYYLCATSSKGAVMMAVYRGKISEGVDFSDSAARAVITIGIPYPNVKEVTIGLKKSYNDDARRTRPELMPGRDWYGAQAFRALNQATGRVIRHKGDWGAIIMLDSRLRYPSSLNNISKWIRRCVTTPETYESFRMRLRQFVDARVRCDQEPDQSRIVERHPEIIIDDD